MLQDKLQQVIYLQRFLTISFCGGFGRARLVCLAYVRGFYFVLCCVEVSAVVLHCVVL